MMGCVKAFDGRADLNVTCHTKKGANVWKNPFMGPTRGLFTSVTAVVTLLRNSKGEIQ